MIISFAIILVLGVGIVLAFSELTTQNLEPIQQEGIIEQAEEEIPEPVEEEIPEQAGESNWGIITHEEGYRNLTWNILEDSNQEVAMNITKINEEIIEVTLFEHGDSTTGNGYKWNMALCGDGSKSLKYAESDNKGSFDYSYYENVNYENLVDNGMSENWCNETGEGFVLFSSGSKNQFPKKIRLNVSELGNMIIYAGTGSAAAYLSAGATSYGNTETIPSCPAHIEDDLLIVAAKNTYGNTISVGTAGWGHIAQEDNNNQYAWFWKRATGPGTAGPAVRSSDNNFAICYVIRGALDTGTPYEDPTITAQARDNHPDTASISTEGDDRLVVNMLAIDDNPGWSSSPPPSGWSYDDYDVTSAGTDNMFTFISKEVASSSTVSAVQIGTVGGTDYHASLTVAFLPPAGPPPADTCTYTSGTWEVDCADNCSIESEVDLGGEDITITGYGTFTTDSDIINYGDLIITGVDSTHQCQVMCNGGCFKT